MHEHIQVIADKCRACRRCEIACIAAHHGLSFKEAMKHRDEMVARVHVVKTEEFKTTVRCHQCQPAPCCIVCPTGALQQEADGRITMRVQHCVACEMCIAACPYGTVTLDTIGMPNMSADDAETLAQRARREVAVRCDMCKAWREENGKKITACIEACPAHALSMVTADGTVIEAPKIEKKAKETAQAQPTDQTVSAAPRGEEKPIAAEPVSRPTAKEATKAEVKVDIEPGAPVAAPVVQPATDTAKTDVHMPVAADMETSAATALIADEKHQQTAPATVDDMDPSSVAEFATEEVQPVAEATQAMEPIESPALKDGLAGSIQVAEAKSPETTEAQVTEEATAAASSTPKASSSKAGSKASKTAATKNKAKPKQEKPAAKTSKAGKRTKK